MSESHRRVLLVDGDPLVVEGMKLLLQDLHCDVALLSKKMELRTLAATHLDCPALIIAPEVMQSGASGERFIHDIRARCRSNIPAILLATEHCFNVESTRQDNIVILSDGLNPKRLRQMISALLDPDKLAKLDE